MPMAVPKRKTSRARRDRRLAHWLASAEVPALSSCPHCGETTVTYRACPECGYYRGRKVLEVKEES